MNRNNLIIIVVAGIIAGGIILSPLWASPVLSLMLRFFTPLPVLFITLGYGTRSGTITAVIALVEILMFTNPSFAFANAILTFIPAVWIGHLIGLAKTQEDGKQIWYPVDKILIRICMLAFIMTVALGVMTGINDNDMQQQIAEQFQQYFDANNISQTEDPQLLAQRTLYWIYIIMPASFIFLFAINIAIASRQARKFAGMIRPTEKLSETITLEPKVAFIFVPVFVITMITDNSNNDAIINVSRVLAGAIGFGYLIVGLSVIHFAARMFKLPSLVLVIVYALNMFGLPTFIYMAIGMFESVNSIRNKLLKK